MGIDVTSLFGRRNDDRWNRTAVGDILERLTWSEPDKIGLSAVSSAAADPCFAAVTYRQADRYANQTANALLRNSRGMGPR